MNIPNHVAIILDGNGRWAKSKGMPRNYGHVKGAQNLEVICRDAYNMGIKYLTVYLFSTENWKRSPDEVDALMKLFRRYTKTCIKTARDNNMKVRVLGDPTALADDLQESLKKLVESSKDNTGLNFQATGKLTTPLGAKLLRSSAVPAGTIIGLDKNYALEQICGSEVVVEYDKLIDRQLERAAITSVSGFAKLFTDAAKVLKV